jgi:hypothetical protein
MARKLKPLTDEEVAAVVKAQVDDAIDYAEEVGDLRDSTTRAYEGEEYGNEVEGRSQLVTREVRDAVEVAKPALMRVLFGSHAIVEYTATEPQDVEAAKDATAWALDAVFNKNRGYMEFLSAVDDALVRKTGLLKPWWEVNETPVKTELTDLTEEQIEILAADEEVEDVEVVETGRVAMGPSPPQPPPMPGQPPMPPPQPQQIPLFDVTVTRIESKGRLRFQAVPTEELIIHRAARNIPEARLVGHRRTVTLSDLMVMGYDWDEISDLPGPDDDYREQAVDARSVGDTEDEDAGTSADPSMREVEYIESWIRIDQDGDGIAELRKICTGGSGHTILDNTLADYAPLVDICPSPVAHQVIGHSLGELVEDIQKLKTMIMRNTMDSLAKSIHPDIEAVEGQVDLDDAMSTEIGKIVRVKAPGMYQYKLQPFQGREIFPVMQYLDTLAESRTGLNEASQGLNADALQSTSTSAIDLASQSAISRIEHIARNFVEGGLKEFFKMMLRIVRENAERAEWVRMSGRFIEVDPRSWKREMDVSPTVALGTGSQEQRLAVLRELAAKQEQIIQTAGPDNPLAGITEYRNTLAEIAKMSGIVDIERFLKDPTDPANQPPPPEPAGPTPEELFAQAEVSKVQQRAKDDDRKHELEVWKAIQADDRERDKMMADMMLRAEELRQKGVSVDIAGIKAEVDRERAGSQHLHNMLQDFNQSRQQAAQEQAQQQQAAQQQQGPQQPPMTPGAM